MFIPLSYTSPIQIVRFDVTSLLQQCQARLAGRLDEACSSGSSRRLRCELAYRSNAETDEGAEPILTASANRGDTAHMLRPYDQITTKQINIYLNGTQILLAQRLGILKEPPEILTREIEDKSKNIPFTKIFLALPLVVLTYIVIARASKNLPVSQLEFAVSAYSICTIFASAFYWSKPQSVGVPRISSTGQLRPVLEIDQWVMSRFGGTSFIETNFCPPFGADPDRYYRKITKNISNDSVVGNFGAIFGTTLHNADFASVLVGTIFGGQKICLYLLLSCYILARVFFIWEMFWTLFYQPEETFQNIQGL